MEISRKTFIRSASWGVLGLSSGLLSCSRQISEKEVPSQEESTLFYRYPALGDDVVSEVVGAAHARFDVVKKLVDRQPELARASWDWGFGDFESALGAASHMGRRDIAEYLISKGARPNLFTYAMFGALDAVKAMIGATPAAHRIQGPHGISLLNHAKHRLRHSDVSEQERKNVNAVIAYLESLEDAAPSTDQMSMSLEEKQFYLGTYVFGSLPNEQFEVSVNRRKMLSIARKGTFGRAMRKVGDHAFTIEGSKSILIRFNIENGKVVSLTIHEPMPVVTATKML